MTDLAYEQDRDVHHNLLDETSDPIAVHSENEVTQAIILASRAMAAIAVHSLGNLPEEVTIPQYRTLVALTHGTRRLVDLAETLDVRPSTTTRMCDRLLRKGLITRRRDVIDRREVILEITQMGRRVVGDVILRRRAEVHALLRQVPVDDQRRLVDSLHLLAGAAGSLLANQRTSAEWLWDEATDGLGRQL